MRCDMMRGSKQAGGRGETWRVDRRETLGSNEVTTWLWRGERIGNESDPTGSRPSRRFELAKGRNEARVRVWIEKRENED